MEKMKIETRSPRTRDWKYGCAIIVFILLAVLLVVVQTYRIGESAGFADGYCLALGYDDGGYVTYTAWYSPRTDKFDYLICARYDKPGGEQ